MACACNDKFVVTTPQGTTAKYNTEFEAKAAQRRTGGKITRVSK